MGFGKTLAKQKPVGTVTYVLDTILLGCTDSPVLELAFAGKGNGPYMSEMLKVANDPRKKIGGGKITERKIDAAAEIEAEIFGKTVLKGWENVAEDEAPGVPIPFSVEKAQEMLLALAEHRYELFRDLVAFARDADNFPHESVDPNAGAELGKK